MSESVDERVSELLEIAHDVESEEIDEETLEAAGEAKTLVRETDPGRLLEALDLTGEDGPETLPEAIATAESEEVEDLHALLEFAKLADDDGGKTEERGERVEEEDERVSELLEVAHNAEGEAVDEETLEAAGEAKALVRETDPGRLLEALGATETAEGSEPETLPEAISAAESESVEDLRALLGFAKLSDDDDERTDEGERAEEGDETVQSEESRDETESESDSSEDSEGDLQTQLRESMQSAFDDFGEDVQGLRDHLEELTDDEEDDVEDEETEADRSRADDERQTAAEDEESEESSGTPSRNAARLSTMAPPPSDRPDVRAVSRHSTMPDRRSRR